MVAVLITTFTGCATSNPPPVTSRTPDATPGVISSVATTPSSSASSSDGQTLHAAADGNRYSLSVTDLVRQDSTATLTVKLRVDEATTSRPGRTDLLADPADSPSRLSGLTNGMGLVDTAGQTLYMPATRTTQPTTALCSPTFPSTVTASDEVTITCLYASVPTKLTAVDVTAPSFGTFHHVPIR